MRSFNTQYTDLDTLKSFINTHNLIKEKNILVQIFSSSVDTDYLLNISSNIKKILPNACVIGTTTCGEICNGKIHNNTTTISFSIFEKTTIKSNFYILDSDFKIEDIKKDLILDNTKALIIFSDGLKSDTDKLLKDIYKIKPNLVVAGGRAGDNHRFIKTYVFDEKSYSDEACVVATLSSDELIANSQYLLNWTPIGKNMIVTKVDKNILYELDGIPILDIYEKYLGHDVVQNLPEACMEFPLILHKDNILIARDPLTTTKDNALVFAGNFEKGDSVQFSFGNIDEIRENYTKYFNEFNKIPAQSIFVYSCAARKMLLGKKLEDEMNILESIAPSVGFFTYGEYFSTSNMIELLNVTTTFLMLSETSKIETKTLKKKPEQDIDIVKKALMNLVKVTTKELKHISTHDMLTSLHNRAEYIHTISLKIKSAKRYKEYFGLILIDIDYFKAINDTYGHLAGDDILRTLAKLLKASVRDDDFVARWGGEEFVIIVKYATIANLEKLIRKIQANIKEHSFAPVPKVRVSFGLSVYIDGDDEDSIFKRVDDALYKAKDKGRDTYVVG